MDIEKNDYRPELEEIEPRHAHLKTQLLQLRRMTSAECIVLVMSKLPSLDDRATFQQSIHGLTLAGLQIKCASILAVLRGGRSVTLPDGVLARETINERPTAIVLPGGGALLSPIPAPKVKAMIEVVRPRIFLTPPPKPIAALELVDATTAGLAVLVDPSVPFAVMKLPRDMASTIKPRKRITNREFPEKEVLIARVVIPSDARKAAARNELAMCARPNRISERPTRVSFDDSVFPDTMQRSAKPRADKPVPREFTTEKEEDSGRYSVVMPREETFRKKR